MRKPTLIRLTDKNMGDAPQSDYVESIKSSTNLMVDEINRIRSDTRGIQLLKNADVELHEIEVSVPDPWIEVGSAGNIQFKNGWSNFGAPYTTAAYMKHPDGTVEVKGTVKGGSIANDMFQLPSGYLPYGKFNIAQASSGAFGLLLVTDIGEFIPAVGDPGDFSIECRFLSKNNSAPFALSCWPKLIKTKFAKVSAVLVASVSDSETTSPLPAGQVHHPAWEMTSSSGSSQVKILNIAGLPYNRKSKINLLIIGG